MSTTTDVAHLRDFRPDQDNARLHDERNLAAIETSMQTTGFGRPILAAKDGTVLAGNATLEAAGNIGMEEVILVHSDGTKPIIHVRTDLDPNSEMARLAAFYDNRTAELASWDTEVLAALMQEVDIAAVAMTPEEAADLIASDGAGQGTEGLTDPDEVPEPPVEPTTRPGDLWVMGDHRVMCGDSTKADDVARLMAGAKAEMVYADPPYGMRLDTDWSDAKSDLRFLSPGISGGRKYEPVVGDEQDFDPRPILSLFPAAETFMWGADYYAERIPAKNDGSWIVWDKRLDESADRMYGSCFELCWSKSKHKRDIARVKWAGVFGTEQEPDRKRHHPTQKPVDLAVWFIERYSKAGDLIADPFLGSGATLLACEQLGRRCLGMELEPKYVDVAVRRWEQFTGGTAELERAP